ncbi:hypothetical protein ACU5AY_05780 [Rhizobium sp. PAMB 3174]
MATAFTLTESFAVIGISLAEIEPGRFQAADQLLGLPATANQQKTQMHLWKSLIAATHGPGMAQFERQFPMPATVR